MGLYAGLAEEILEASIRIISPLPVGPVVIGSLLRPQFKEDIVILGLDIVFNYPGPGPQEGNPDFVVLENVLVDSVPVQVLFLQFYFSGFCPYPELGLRSDSHGLCADRVSSRRQDQIELIGLVVTLPDLEHFFLGKDFFPGRILRKDAHLDRHRSICSDIMHGYREFTT